MVDAVLGDGDTTEFPSRCPTDDLIRYVGPSLITRGNTFQFMR